MAILAIISLLFLFSIANILVPFVSAFVIAYILLPVINNRYISSKLSHDKAACLLFILVLGSFILFLWLFLPLLLSQLYVLIGKIPQWANYVRNNIVPPITSKYYSLDPQVAGKIKDTMESLINDGFSLALKATENVWGYTMATINALSLIFFVPIILFYFLRDWHRIKLGLGKLVPKEKRAQINEVLHSINQVLSSYIRGQFNVCFLMSCFYMIGLSVIGLDVGIFLGVMSGLLIILPFVGILISFSVSIIVGYFTFGGSIQISYIAALYIIGHLLESFILSPIIIGDKIGLHPLWIMFAILACGSLVGFIGVLAAVPVAGVIKVLLKHVLKACFNKAREN